MISEYKEFFINLKKHMVYEEEAMRRIKEYFDLDDVPLLNIDATKYRYYDFVDEMGRRYEVKCDRRSRDTGNYFIEYENRGRPSGLSTTTANYYIITDGKGEFNMIETGILKWFIEYNYPRKLLINDSRGYLVSVEDLKEFMVSI